MRTRLRNKPAQQNKLSYKNIAILFAVCVFIMTNTIYIFEVYGAIFGFIALFTTLVLSLILSIYSKIKFFQRSALHKLFLWGSYLFLYIIYMSILTNKGIIIVGFILLLLAALLLYFLRHIFLYLFDEQIKERYPSKSKFRSKNFLNHHNYARRKDIIREYNRILLKREIKGSAFFYLFISAIMGFVTGGSEGNLKVGIGVFLVFFVITFGISILNILKSYFFKPPSKDKKIYWEHMGKIKYYEQSGSNIFFY